MRLLQTPPSRFSESISDFSKLKAWMPLLAHFETWMSSMSGALRRLQFIQIKKRIGGQSFCLLFLLTRKSKVADRAKTLLINIKVKK